MCVMTERQLERSTPLALAFSKATNEMVAFAGSCLKGDFRAE